MGHLGRQTINLTPPKSVKAWGDGPLRLEVCPVTRHTRPDPCRWHHGRPKYVPSTGFSWLKSDMDHTSTEIGTVFSNFIRSGIVLPQTKIFSHVSSLLVRLRIFSTKAATLNFIIHFIFFLFKIVRYSSLLSTIDPFPLPHYFLLLTSFCPPLFSFFNIKKFIASLIPNIGDWGGGD